MMTAQQAAVVAEARSYKGTRWLHQGRSRAGIDCIGLVIEVAKTVKGWTFDTTDYARQATDETMLRVCRQHLIEVKKTDLQPGDVVVMRFENQRHAGLIGDYPAPGELSLIHAYARGKKVVVEHRLDSVWLSCVIGCFRFPDEGVA
jgi:cell wall-associated NlpC family hydrolase